MKSPFKFLDAYTLKDKDVFFGRDKEADALYEMVFRTPVILVYGLSGTGKTSLVQCGLASRFDGPEWYPFFVRRQDNINDSLRAALRQAIAEPMEGATLPELVGEVFEEYLSPVYLIFDQFEELFILGKPAEQAAFAEDIKALLAAELPCKLLFIIREEYLGQLYPLERAIPTLFDFRLRVEPMNNTRVTEVLRSSFEKFNISLEPPAENRLQEIIDNVSAGKSGIQLPYLQVYLDQLWREDYERTYPKWEVGSGKSELDKKTHSDFRIFTRPKHEDGPTSDFLPLEFTQQEIQSFGRIENVLDKFLQQQREELQEQLEREYSGIPEQAVRQVLDVFVTAEGTKRPVHFIREAASGQIVLEESVQELLPEIMQPPGHPISPSPSHPVTQSSLTTCLEALEQRRLLRFADAQIELAHDSLAALIDEQRTDEQRQLNEIRLRIAGAYREWERTEKQEYLTRRQLLSIEELLPKVPLEPHLKQFVADCYAFNDAQEEAQRQREREELEKERRLRGEAEAAQWQAEENAAQAKAAREQAEENAAIAAANARQARRRTRLAWIISAFALVVAGFAFWQYKQAENAKSTAEERRIAAERSDSIAQEKAVEAQLSDSIAQVKALEAGIKALEAQTSDSIAQLRAREALKNLNGLEQASEEIATLLIADAKALVYELQHEEALEKLRAAIPLNKKVDEVARGLTELAFFYNQAGKRALALGIADTVAILKNDRRARGLLSQAKAGGESQRLIDSALSVISPVWHKAMMERYYPAMMPVEGGEFCMNRDPKETGVCDTSQYTLVTLKNFKLAKTETTAWQFYLFSVAKSWEMEPPSWGWDGDNPIVNVNWYDAVAYSNWASESLGMEPYYTIDSIRQDTNNSNDSDKIKWKVQTRQGANGFRLPSEAEWEYAARGGKQLETFIYSGDDSLNLVAWHYYNSDEEYGVKRTHPVAKKKANALGVFDMSGNVWEWSWDWGDSLERGVISNPPGPNSGSKRVLRGGSWYGIGTWIYRVDLRDYVNPSIRLGYVGFRLAQD